MPWLTPDEVGELTQLKPGSWAAQRRRLARMGVPFRPNAVGRPLVERATVLQHRTKPERRPDQPNFDALKSA